jgi:hypothetical protein
MKKILPAICMSFLLPICCFGQRLDENKVPVAARQAFAQKYPGITGKWEKEDGNFEVNFIDGQKTMSAVIDAKGSVLETETTMTLKEIPAAILSYIKDHKKGGPVKAAERIVRANGETIYEIRIGKKELLFDVDGKFIKEAKD